MIELDFKWENCHGRNSNKIWQCRDKHGHWGLFRVLDCIVGHELLCFRFGAVTPDIKIKFDTVDEAIKAANDLVNGFDILIDKENLV